jgi:hypothetical protein
MLKERPTPAQIERAVHDRIRRIVDEEKGACPRFGGADRLETIGLASLDLARLVAELEAELGRDPFAALVPITSVRSVDDLVEAYVKAFSPDPGPAAPDPSLAAAAERAEARRSRRAGR